MDGPRNPKRHGGLVPTARVFNDDHRLPTHHRRPPGIPTEPAVTNWATGEFCSDVHNTELRRTLPCLADNVRRTCCSSADAVRTADASTAADLYAGSDVFHAAILRTGPAYAPRSAVCPDAPVRLAAVATSAGPGLRALRLAALLKRLAAIEQQRDRTVVHERDFHVLAKAAGLDGNAAITNLANERS